MKNSEKHQEQFDCNSKGHLFGEFKDATYEEWKGAATVLLKGKPFEKEMLTKTPEGITLQPIYLKDSLDNFPHTDSLPGFPPYVRGTKVEGNMVEPWGICQELYAGQPKEFNQLAINDLYRGQTVLNMVLDKPTGMGLDPDHADAVDVGVKGVSISTLEDLSVALHDLVLEVLPVHINTGVNPVPLTALIGAYCKKNEQDLKQIKGVIGFDPLGELAKHGKLAASLKASYDRMADVLKWVNGKGSEVRTILIEGHPYHNGGADTVQELAYALSVGAEYVREMINRGMDIEAITPKMAFSFSLGSNFFMEISKLRAARMLWSKIIEAFGGSDHAQKMYIHGKTSSWTKTVYDPYVNMLRNASEAFSGAVAGVDSLTVVSFDEPIREADDFSRRISRNVQSILQDECHFTQPVDPVGGSWYIESLTHEIAQRAWEVFQEIEAHGGMSTKLIKGEIQSAVALKYEEKFKNMAKRKHIWVGVNMYANMKEKKLKTHEKDCNALRTGRVKAVQNYRNSKDMFQIGAYISELGDHHYLTGQISIDIAVDAALHGATLGDIAEMCYGFTDEACQVEAIKFERGAERFEVLRDQTNLLQLEGKAPKIFLFNMGPIPQHKARADFSTGFFEVGGFEVISNTGFNDAQSAVAAGLSSGAHVGVICSTDAVYPEFVPEIAQLVKAQRPDMILVVAGRPPKEQEEEYREAGVDHFIYLGADCYSLLSTILKEVATHA